MPKVVEEEVQVAMEPSSRNQQNRGGRKQKRKRLKKQKEKKEKKTKECEEECRSSGTGGREVV